MLCSELLLSSLRSERRMKPLLPRTESYLVPIQLPVASSVYLPSSSAQFTSCAPQKPSISRGAKRVRIAPKVKTMPCQIICLFCLVRLYWQDSFRGDRKQDVRLGVTLSKEPRAGTRTNVHCWSCSSWFDILHFLLSKARGMRFGEKCWSGLARFLLDIFCKSLSMKDGDRDWGDKVNQVTR